MRRKVSSCFDHARRHVTDGILIALLFSGTGAAEEPLDAPRVLSDPTFLPSARQFVGHTEYANSNSGGDVRNYLGVKQYSFDHRSQSGYQLLAYGITDRLSVGASGFYISGDTEFELGNGTSKSVSGSGSRIAVGATYRLLEQPDFPVSLDLSAVVRTGGSPLGVSAEVGYWTRKFTISGVLGANQFNGGSYTAQPQEVPGWVDESRRYFVGINTQTRFFDSLSLNLGVRYSAPMGSVDAMKDGKSYTAKFADVVSTTVALNYHFIPNKLVAKMGYSFEIVGKTRDQYADATLNTTFDNDNGRAFSVGLLYAF